MQLASFRTCKLLFSVSSEPFLLTKHLRERDLTVRLQYLLITHAAHFLVTALVPLMAGSTEDPGGRHYHGNKKRRSTQLRPGTGCCMNFSGNKKAERPLQDTQIL